MINDRISNKVRKRAIGRLSIDGRLEHNPFMVKEEAYDI
jgi:hypothetical protein